MIPQPQTPIVNFIVYDAQGRVTESGAQERAFCEQRIKAGEHLIYTADFYGDAVKLSKECYVDISSGAGVFRFRPLMSRKFNRDEMLPRQEATLKSVPACIVSFSGPVSGTQNHSDGDLSIGFTVPGVYELKFEAFPFKEANYTLKVVPAISVSQAGVSVSV